MKILQHMLKITDNRSKTAFSIAERLPGGGEMGERIRGFNWSRTSLGPIEGWSHSLFTALRIMLASRQPIWLGWGPDLIKFYNDPYIAIVGGKHPAALGQPASVVWREIWNEIGPMLETAVGGVEGTYVEEQLLIMERYGYPEETYYTFSYSPIPDDDGSVGGIFCANTDDTRRVIGERQLALLRELAAKSSDAMTVEDACKRSAECLATNQRDLPFAMIYLLDSQAEELILKSCADGLAPGNTLASEHVSLREPSVWPFAEVLALNQSRVVRDLRALEGAMPRGAWDRAPQEAAAVPIAAQGRTGLIGILVAGLNPYRLYDESYRGFLELVAAQISANIASAQAYEEERKRAQALAEIDRAKTEFFSNVSHEFRTPLTLMLGPLENLVQNSNGELSLDARAKLEVAHRNSLRLLKLVNTLLDFSRIEAGRMQAMYEPTELGGLTAELASIFRSAIEGAGIELKVRCTPLSAPVYVDREMWEKIVLNLLSNAYKFTFAGEIEISMRQANGAVEVSVRDTGTGIPPEELPHLFERFHRVKDARGRSYEGSGIGLALVQELVKLHGGSIEVTSRPGQGSTFTVTLPTGKAHLPVDRLRDSHSPSAPVLRGNAYVEEALRWKPEESGVWSPWSDEVPPKETSASDKLTPDSRLRTPDSSAILLADDNADMREYVRRLLVERGYQVVVVGDGETALDAMRQRNFDLLLTDVMMPNLDGFGLLKALRADERMRRMPVIMLSARAGEEARVEGMEIGADDYLVKPFSARELVARVESLLYRRRSEAALQASERKLSAIYDNSPDSLCLLQVEPGRQFRFVSVNETFLAVSGFKREQIEGALIERVIPADKIEMVRAKYEQVLATKESLLFEEQADLPAGLRFGEIILTPIFAADQSVTHILCVIRDVTGRKRTERALAQRTAQFETLLDQAPIGVYLIDADFRIRQVNPAARPSFVKIPDLIGRDFEEVVHILWWKEYADEIIQLFRHTLATGEPYTSPERSEERRDLGVTEYYEWQIHRIPLPEGQYGVVCYFRDISAQVSARKAVEEANRLKDEFLATLSHELRNPLNTITGYADILLRSAEAKSIPLIHQAAATIHRNAEAQAQLINDLLDLSRLQTGKLGMDRKPLILASVVGDAIESVRGQAAAKGLSLTVDFDDALILVNADPVRIQQVVWNLVSNAVKFTPSGGEVLVRLCAIGRDAYLIVEDTGEGISPQFLPLVFEMFRQADAGTKRTHGGMGIGLALVKQLVELHGGQVAAYSEGKGRGARFTVQLPLHDGADPRPGTTASSSKDELAGACILVVDDSQDSQEMLRILLSGEGALVTTGGNGLEGLQQAMRGEFDLIVSDISMPVMDGYEFLKNLRETEPRYLHIPAIALTGFGREEDITRARQVGFTTHLTKPLDFDQLLRLARLALRR